MSASCCGDRRPMADRRGFVAAPSANVNSEGQSPPRQAPRQTDKPTTPSKNTTRSFPLLSLALSFRLTVRLQAIFFTFTSGPQLFFVRISTVVPFSPANFHLSIRLSSPLRQKTSTGALSRNGGIKPSVCKIPRRHFFFSPSPDRNFAPPHTHTQSFVQLFPQLSAASKILQPFVPRP